jgi:cytochrome c peroxidase
MRSVLIASIALCAAGCISADRSSDGLRCRRDPADPTFDVCDLSLPHLEQASAAPTSGDVNPRLMRRFLPLRKEFHAGPELPAELVALGRMLYFDPRLSRSSKVSCNSCHPLERYGTTSDSRSPGVDGQRGARNAPSTYNAAGQFSQFWDGRSGSVEEQALVPITTPIEMGMTAEGAVARLKEIPGYAEPFRAAFPAQPRPLTFKNIGAAIGAFEQTLATPGRWDQYVRGDRSVLTEKEKEGLRIFTSVGCMVCHTGELVGGSMYEKLGVVEPWPNKLDHGRAAITKNPADELVFKVPSLRNVSRTGPYFHDGSVRSLNDAVRMMGNYQLGVDLNDGEVEAVVAWLGSLSGELPEELVRAPSLPPSAEVAWKR